MKAWIPLLCASLALVGCRDTPAVDGSDTGTGTSGDEDGSDSGDSTTGDELDPRSVPEPRAGRLTDVQYRYALLDVLGVELNEEELDALPRDIPTGRDYSTTISPQPFDANYVLGYAEVARSVSARLDPAALLAEHAGCDGVDEGCRPALIEGLGLRLFRRPLGEDEVARYLDLAMTIAAADETDESHVVRGLVQAMLQAPAFLYRAEDEISGEPGQVREVDGYELASRLSFFLWQSAPDEELLDFAAGPDGDGRFDPEALPAQVDRMLADPRFGRARALFWGDYTMAARSGFATSDAHLAEQLRRSLLATLDRISGIGAPAQPLSALFDGDELVMTPDVAELAGLPPSGNGFQVYSTADDPQRTGVVTHPAFLASIGTPSFVGRGLFFSERLLCQHAAEPPPGIGQEIEDTAQATEDMTPREASEFRMEVDAVCRGCHLQFEPVAYAFERFDTWGRFTLTDELGRDLYSDGVLPAFGDRPELSFDDAPGLLRALADMPTVSACMVENMTEFGTGRRANLLGDFHLNATARFVDQGRTFDALARAVASSEQRTLTRVVEP